MVYETQDSGWTRYIPNPVVAPNGSQEIQFTYSAEFLAQWYGTDEAQLQDDLDAFAAKLCDEIDNPLGVNKPDLGLLHDVYQVTEFRPYEYGDAWFISNGGGNFLLDQNASYEIEVRGKSVFRATQAAYNHVDIIFKTTGPPHLYEDGTGGTSDANDEAPPYQDRSVGDNGVSLRRLPAAPDWVGYAVAIHELGHLFDFTAYDFDAVAGGNDSGKEGFGQEARANLGRRYAGIDFPVHGGFHTPFNKCYYRTGEWYGYPERWPRENEPTEWDYGGGRADDLGETFWGYLAEHFNYGTASTISDDLAAQFVTYTTYRNGDERFANTYMYSLGQLLDDPHYDDQQLYPYFSDAGAPLPGEERLAVLFQNFAIAVGVNAPAIGSGEFGFPLEYRPTYNWQYFVSNPPYDRSSIPPVTTITAGDYNTTRLIGSPFEMPDASLYELQVHPWNMEMWVFDVDATADPNGSREVAIRVIGEGMPYDDPGSSYFNEVHASIVMFSDLEGGWIHESPDKILSIQHLSGNVVAGDLEFVATVPTHAGARHALLVMSMAERNMPEFLDAAHPLYDQPYDPWAFEIEYTLRDVPSPVTLENQSAATTLDYEGQPYSSVTLDYNGDSQQDLFVSVAFGSGQDESSLHELTAIDPNGVPTFSKVTQVYEGGSEPLFQRGVCGADYDNDGDMDFFVGGSFNPHLYRNDGGFFSDQASSSGLYPDAEHSWAGSWGDFDRDGYLDLFVGRGESSVEPTTTAAEFPNYLFRNETGSGGGFVNVSASANVDQDPLQQDCTLGAAWADFDADGDLDLFTTRIMEDGSPNGPYQGSLLFVNQDDGTFVESSDSVFDENIVYVSGAVWADLDENGELDLIVSGQNAPNLGGLRVYTQNAGSLSLASPDMGLDLDWDASGVFVFDHDLDGTTDLLGIPFDPGTPPHLYAGFRAGSTIVWADQSANVGLEVAKTGGAVVQDFNGDGDLDVFLGRRTSTNKYFYRALWNGVDAPTNNYVAIQLRAAEDDQVTWDGGNNYNGVGATLTLAMPASNPAVTQTRVIDGGSSRGGQGPSTIVFGLGSYTDALLTVAWPDGSSQTRAINSGEINNGGAPLVVFDTHMPALNQPSVSASIELLPNLKINWVFTWETGNSTDPKKDTVKVQTYDPGGKYTPPPQCVMSPVTLRYDTSNVVHTYVAKQGGGYTHTLRYENRPCNAPCTFEYQVTSALSDSRKAQSPWKQFTVPVCVQ